MLLFMSGKMVTVAVVCVCVCVRAHSIFFFFTLSLFSAPDSQEEKHV